MSKAQLLKAIQVVNNRSERGLNDDDQVARMCQIDLNTKGYTFRPLWNSYEICTDYERLKEIADKYGYWHKYVMEFNDRLTKKGGFEYMSQLNNKYREEAKQQPQTNL